jgi:serine/threonine protein kinase
MWEANWKRGKRLGHGGQGTTWLVASKASELIAVMKVLHPVKSRNEQARARMVAEVANLKALAAAGGSVPGVIEDNLELFKSSDVELYFIMEFVQGPTLLKYVASRKRLPYSEAATVLRALCRTVQLAHSIGVLHRDIKPDNIIIRTNDGAFDSAVIVDFGISYHETDQATLTKPLERLGNKFLILPESTTPGADRRDSRSDVAYLVGLFFYMLTGIVPEFLHEARRLAPHWRTETPAFAAVKFIRESAALSAFFDRGFCHDVDYRFQSVEELLTYLPVESVDGAKPRQIEVKLSNRTWQLLPGAMALAKLHDILFERPLLGVTPDFVSWLEKYITLYMRFCIAGSSGSKDRLISISDKIDAAGRSLERDELTDMECRIISDIFHVVTHRRLECVRRANPDCLSKEQAYVSVFQRHPAASNYYPMWGILQRIGRLHGPIPPIIYRDMVEYGGITCWRCAERPL